MNILGALGKLLGAAGNAIVPKQIQDAAVHGRFGEQNPFWGKQQQAQPQRPALQVLPPVAPRPGAGWNGLQQSTSFDNNLQGYNQDDLSQGLQGGVVNQGYIPLQNSGYGLGNLQGGINNSSNPLQQLLRRR